MNGKRHLFSDKGLTHTDTQRICMLFYKHTHESYGSYVFIISSFTLVLTLRTQQSHFDCPNDEVGFMNFIVSKINDKLHSSCI